ncbi:hypothetical protein FHU38_001248 [Saccharomonospora amisosensis]|uniref:DUF3558 domain-containing protein n=1 Tax=Saccharomonospora amisosensis TaxID=1128677 RepID=A0A7X5UNI7_9PSEU|nr:DUF3558 family protein [Saccharomonospora amisosensis]NIJ10904.1 hypothetical protein [Saccharomonospora amisosensis]
MLSRVPALAALLAAALAGLLGGCAGEDLSRSNFERTTVPAEPGSGEGDVPTGPITDPAVSASALRMVNPCALLSAEPVADFERVVEPTELEWGACRTEVRDAGGKTLVLSLQLGESLVVAEQATAAVEGLPLVENRTDDETCFVTAVTSRGPSMGVGLQVQYAGGEPCGQGIAVLGAVVRSLRADPPTYSAEPGSLLPVEPCESVPTATVTDVLGEEATRQAAGLHACQFQSGSSTVHVRFRTGYPPDPADGTKIDIGGVTAVREPGATDTAECDVSWRHRAVAEGSDEIVSVSYYGYGEDTTKDDACVAATEFAKSVVAALPSR